MIINEDGIERKATKEELAQHKADNEARDAHNKAIAEKIAAKEAILKKLGITDEEAALLLA